VECLYWNVVAFVALLVANDSAETCGSTQNSHFDCLRFYGGGQHHHYHTWQSPSLGPFWVPALLWMWRASIAWFVSLPFPFIPYQCPDSIRATVWHRNVLTIIVVPLKVEGGSSIHVPLLCFWGTGLFLCFQPPYMCNTHTVHPQHGLQAMWCANGSFKTVLFIWQHCCHYFLCNPHVNKIA